MISVLHPRISNSDGTTTATIDIQRIKSSVHIIMNLIIVFFFVLLQRQKHSEFPMFFVNSGGLQIAMQQTAGFHQIHNGDFTRTRISPATRGCLDQPKASNDQHVFVWEHLVVPNILSWSSNM